MSSKIENNNKTSFPSIKIIVLGVLLTSSIIGGLCYYFIKNKKPSEELIQEAIKQSEEEIQEIEDNYQEDKQVNEVIINNEKDSKNNEYIPIIDITWLSYLMSLIIFVVSFIMFVRLPFSPLVICHQQVTENENEGKDDSICHLQRKIINKHFLPDDEKVENELIDNKKEEEKKNLMIQIRQIMIRENRLVGCKHYLFYLLFCFITHFIISLIGSGIAKIKSSLSYGRILMHALFRAPTLRGWHIIWNLFFVFITGFIFWQYFSDIENEETKFEKYLLLFSQKHFQVCKVNIENYVEKIQRKNKEKNKKKITKKKKKKTHN